MHASPSPSVMVKGAAHGGKYLSLLLQNELYCIPVLDVREIIRLTPLTRVPQMPAYVSGVLNLRGRVIAVIDLRTRFGLQAEITDRTCIVVVHATITGARTIHLGFIVDAVEEVVSIPAADIEPTPDVGLTVDSGYLVGMAKTKNRVSMLLDIQRVVSADAVSELVA